MPNKEIIFPFRLPEGADVDQATLDRIRRDLWDSMGKEWNRLVMLGKPVRVFTPEELIERRCEDAIRQCGLPRSLRRLPTF